MRKLPIYLALICFVSLPPQAIADSYSTKTQVLLVSLIASITIYKIATYEKKEEDSYYFHSFIFEISKKTDIEVWIRFKEKVSGISFKHFSSVEEGYAEDGTYCIYLKIPHSTSTDENRLTASFKSFGLGVPEIIFLKDDRGVHTPIATRSKFIENIETSIDKYRIFTHYSHKSPYRKEITVIMMKGIIEEGKNPMGASALKNGTISNHTSLSHSTEYRTAGQSTLH